MAGDIEQSGTDARFPVILCVSDLHFRHDEGEQNKARRKNILSELVETIVKVPSEWRPSILCVCGDIAFSGCNADYELAKRWLDALLNTLSIDISNVIMSPGNHDVPETRSVKRPSSPSKADGLLEKPSEKGFEAYCRFCEDAGIARLDFGDSTSCLVGQRRIQDMRFVVCNSSWFSQPRRNDRGKLWLGLPHLQRLESERQLPLLRAKSGKRDGPITIALLHHPKAWLHENELNAYGYRPATWDYLADRCHLIFSGHAHGEELRPAERIGHYGTLYLEGGAAYDSSAHTNTFHLVRVASRAFTFKPFIFNSKSSHDMWREQEEYERPFVEYSQGAVNELTAQETERTIRSDRSSNVIGDLQNRQIIVVPSANPVPAAKIEFTVTSPKRAAVQHLLEACRLMPGEDALLKKTATLAFECNALDIATEVLENLIQLAPDDVDSRRNASIVYVHMGDFEKAAAEFAALARLERTERTHSLNQAIMLARTGDLKSALDILEQKQDDGASTLQELLVKADLLNRTGKPSEGFSVLHAVRNMHWETPEFLMAYMLLAYAAGKDLCAEEALVQLKQLQDAGKTQQGILERKSLDDIVAILRQERKRETDLLAKITRGEVPWLLVDSLLGKPSYWAWRLRTQESGWIPEHPHTRAALGVYSTNGFTVRRGEKFPLCQLDCPESGTHVVADPTSLITLHRLGMLERATQYFGEILVPTECMSLALEERSRLSPHQLSQFTFFEEVHQALVHDQLCAVAPDSSQVAPTIVGVVDEYGIGKQNEIPSYGLCDVVEVLHDLGRVDGQRYTQLNDLVRRRSPADDVKRPLSAGERVMIALSSLKTLYDFGLFEAVVETFDIVILTCDREEVLTGLRSFALQAEAREWHAELWDTVRANSRIVLTPCPRGHKQNRNIEEDTREAFLLSANIAQNRKLPLLVDDRFLQGVVLNISTKVPMAAFGTDVFLAKLRECEVLTPGELTDSFLELIRWRYRFLVPPVAVLKECADRFKSSLPGSMLIEISRYLHDCMLDPGLFTGPESKEPPASMACALFHSWASLAGHFIMLVWGDPSYDVTQATGLTKWIVEELLPPATRRMGIIGYDYAGMSGKMVLISAMSESCVLDDENRANNGLLAIRDAFRMESDEYVNTVGEILSYV